MALGLARGSAYAGFHVIREIGRGGFGLVYLVREPGGAERALKILSALHGRHTLDARKFREVEVANKVQDGHIVKVLGSGVEGGDPWILMEYVNGRTLERRIIDSPTTVAHARDILVQLCRGIAAAHAANVAHCDLKPENVMVEQSEDGTDLVKILDFGLAKFVGKHTTGMTKGPGGGTAGYMPPEQYDGRNLV